MGFVDMKPKLRFSKWIKWANRCDFKSKEQPGVYMLAITRENLEGKYPDFNDVVYIGMTNSQGGLTSRWKQFHDSINGKNQHSGGNRVYKELHLYKQWKKKLFVCACPLKCETRKDMRCPSDLIRMGRVAFWEYEALSRYKKETGKEPHFNKK